MTPKKSLQMRQSVRQEKNTPKAGKGWRGNWRDQIRLDHTKMGKEQGILLSSGEYSDRRPESLERGGETVLAYHTRHVHTFALPSAKGAPGYRSTTCRKYHDGTACLACDEFAAGNRKIDGGRKAKARPRSKFSINAIEFNLYEPVDAKAKDGTPIRHEKDHPEGKYKRGDVIKNWEAVENLKERKNLMANQGELAALVDDGEIRLWRKGFIEVGFGHLGCVEEIADKAAEFCKCGGNLVKSGYVCSAENCGHVLLDINEDDATEDMLARFDREQETCSKCGETGFPNPMYECDDCSDPEPYGWDEVVAFLRKSGDGAQTTIVIDKVIPLDAFTTVDGRPVLKTDKEGLSIVDDDGRFQFIDALAPLVKNQFDFESIHEPVDNDMIASWLQIDNKYKAGASAGRRDAPKTTSDDEAETESTDTTTRRSRGKPGSEPSGGTGRRIRG